MGAWMMFVGFLVINNIIARSPTMSQRLKYKVISYSSEEPAYPASSLAVPGTDGWQSKRFCNYPQEVTLEFYGVTHVGKIEILADNRKIAETVDLLYYDPTESGAENRFTKYGSVEFSRNKSGRIHEQKTVIVDMRCLYLRLLFQRPYKNIENFFSQVYIHQMAVYGG
jgi:centrosomal protein CEP104